MGKGIVILFISGAWALILLVRVQSLFGQHFFIISGDNMMNARGFALGNGTYLFFWLIALAGFCLGIWSIISDLKKKNQLIAENGNKNS